MKKIVAINLGSTSTKIAYYEDERCVFKDNIKHEASVIRAFDSIWDQLDYRTKQIEQYLEQKGIKIEELDAVATRGGHTQPITGGTYRVTEKMLEQSRSEKYGNHPTDLGLQIVTEFAKRGVQAFTVDPPSTDEFEPLARYSGIPGMERRSSFHVLNHRAVGRQYAKDQGERYEDLNLIGVHMGGGISVAVHKKGKLVDANNALDGDGPFSANRCCTVPVGELVRLCYSGDYTYPEMKKLINGNSGLVGYLGENDAKTIEERAKAGDEMCQEVMQAMCYQVAKEIGADATVLKGEVDAILFTGGMSYSEWIVGMIADAVRFIAPIAVYPGEYEMQALGLNTLAALNGEIEIRELK